MTRRAVGIAVVLLLASACARSEPCADGDCPRLVTHGGRDYVVSTSTPVSPRLLGRALDVTDADERELGPGYAVDGYELNDVDPAEAIAVRFEGREYGRGGPVIAFAEDLPRERRRDLTRLLEK